MGSRHGRGGHRRRPSRRRELHDHRPGAAALRGGRVAPRAIVMALKRFNRRPLGAKILDESCRLGRRSSRPVGARRGRPPDGLPRSATALVGGPPGRGARSAWSTDSWRRRIDSGMTIERRARVSNATSTASNAHSTVTTVEVVAPVHPVRRPLVERDGGAEALDARSDAREPSELHAGLHQRPAHELTGRTLVEHRAPALDVLGRLAAPQQHHRRLGPVATSVVALLGGDRARHAHVEAALAHQLERRCGGRAASLPRSTVRGAA